MKNNAQNVFRKIYNSHSWGSTSRSGPGSEPQRLQSYMAILVDFLKTHQIQSVVDIGCGDWAFSRLIDWSGIDYTGIDIVPELAERNNERYGNDHIRFLCRNLITDELPAADLCIIKDCLQHLSNSAVHEFLKKLSNYRYALLTNDIGIVRKGWWANLWRTGTETPNCDIRDGAWRPLKLRGEPFMLPAQQLSQFDMHIVFNVLRFPLAPANVTKEVLLWKRAVAT